MIRRITMTPSSNVLSGKYRDGDIVLVFCDASNDSFSITLPVSVSSDTGYLFFVKTDSTRNSVTLRGTINGASNYSISRQYQSVMIIKNNDDWYIINNSTTATVALFS